MVLGRRRLARDYRKMYSLMGKTVRLVLLGVKSFQNETGITLSRRLATYIRTSGFRLITKPIYRQSENGPSSGLSGRSGNARRGRPRGRPLLVTHSF